MFVFICSNNSRFPKDILLNMSIYTENYSGSHKNIKNNNLSYKTHVKHTSNTQIHFQQSIFLKNTYVLVSLGLSGQLLSYKIDLPT